MNWGTQNYVSLGGLFVGMGIIFWHTALWWVGGGKTAGNWRALLIPFIPIFLYGMLLILSAGGILGWVAQFSLWGSNVVGDATLEYGVGGGTQNVTRTTNVVLTAPGHMVVGLITIVMVAVWMYSKKISRMSTLLYMLSGICLGLSSGVAGVFAWAMAPSVDTVGGVIAGVL